MHLQPWPRALIHIDCDAFFASCEQATHPEYRGMPVVTGKERGIVAAASYEAKACGVKRGVPLWEVKKLCPNAIILPSDYETYSLFSKRLFAIIRRFTPSVEEYSIDEAFADITGFRRAYHSSYENIALKIKTEIESNLGITVSVGLSVSKVLCKIGSKWKKPAGLTIIPANGIEGYLADYPVENIWGIGPRTAAYCNANRIHTALDFAQKSEEYIKSHFTKPHYEIWQELNGRSVYKIVTEEHTGYATISKTKTFTPPSSDPAYIFSELVKNLENACIKARRHNLVAKSFIAFIKDNDFHTNGAEAALSRPSAFPNDMIAALRQIFQKLRRGGPADDNRFPSGPANGAPPSQPVRQSRGQSLHIQTSRATAPLTQAVALAPRHFAPQAASSSATATTPRLYRATGIVLTKLQPDRNLQLSLFDPPVKLEKLTQIYKTVDQISARLGKHKIHLGASFLANKKAQHLYDRGDIPLRKTNRLKGETSRKHLPLPMLMNPKGYKTSK